VAHEDDGPHIPVLPALAIVRALAEGRLNDVGAVACAVSLSDMRHEFARLRIVTRTMVRPQGVMQRALGRAFDVMPEVVRRGHRVDGRLVLEGRASVTGAASLPGRLLARLLGFPPGAADVPVVVDMRAGARGEVWTRSFAGRTFRSRLAPIPGRGKRVTERFGWLTFDLQLSASPQGLDLDIVAARLGPLRLPRALTPRSHATERIDEAGRFRFEVPIALPGLGPLVHYRGWLKPAAADASVRTPHRAAGATDTVAAR
jgi:hypothetical protein